MIHARSIETTSATPLTIAAHAPARTNRDIPSEGRASEGIFVLCCCACCVVVMFLLLLYARPAEMGSIGCVSQEALWRLLPVFSSSVWSASLVSLHKRGYLRPPSFPT